MRINKTFKFKKDIIREKNIEDQIKKYLSSHKDIFYYKVFGSGLQLKGIPDIICSVNGYFVGFEIKRPKGKPQISQILCGFRIIESGGIYVIVDNLDIIKKIIDLLKNKDIKSIYNLIGYTDVKSFITYISKKYKIELNNERELYYEQ